MLYRSLGLFVSRDVQNCPESAIAVVNRTLFMTSKSFDAT